jgi:hypothetical protein
MVNIHPMKDLLISTALLLACLSAFSQQREMVQMQRAETSQQASSTPQQTYQQYTPPAQQVTYAQSNQQAVTQNTPPSNPPTNGIQIVTERSNNNTSHTSEYCNTNNNNYGSQTPFDMTQPLAEPIGGATSPTIVNCADNEMQLVYICPFCGRLYYKGLYCPYDNTELVPEYANTRGISR